MFSLYQIDWHKNDWNGELYSVLTYFIVLRWHLISYIYVPVSIYHHMLSNIVNPLQTPNHTSKQRQVSASLSKALCKCTQHCWPTTPNIVGCYMLRLLHILLHVVGTCCTMFENSKIFSYVQMDATTTNNVGSCWPTMLCPFVQGLRDCRKILLPLGLIKKTFCYRKESVRSGSTTPHFLMKLISDIHRFFLYNMLICSLFVCFFQHNQSCDARFWWKNDLRD